MEFVVCIVSNSSPDDVERVDTDRCRLEKLDPAIVDKEFLLSSIYVINPLFTPFRLVLIVTNSFPITVEKDETDWKIPVELMDENTDPTKIFILDAFVEIPALNSEKLAASLVDRFEIAVERFRINVDVLEPICVEIKRIDSPIPPPARKATELSPSVNVLMANPADVDRFNTCVDAFCETFVATVESPTFRKLSSVST
jgi:hypothetical protein